jgi:hypothetical protein
MGDLRERLADAVADERPRKHAPGLVRRSLRNHRRRQRLAAGFLGTLVAAGVVWMTVVGFADRRAAPRPDVGSTEFLDLSRLERVWSADVPGTAFESIGNIVSDEANVYVGTTQGAVAYPKACATDPCPPAWELHVAPGGSESSHWRTAWIAAGDGVVVAALEGRLAVVAADCRSDGGVCSPLWGAEAPKSSNGFTGPLMGGGVVRAVVGYNEAPDQRVDVIAFDADCRRDGGTCEPAWTADGGVGTIYSPGTFVNGVFYQQVGLRMTGFAANCSSDGGTCQPDLSITSDGAPNDQTGTFYGPALGEGEVIFVAGTGVLTSYTEHCGTECRPRWVGRVADYLEAYPVTAGNVVMTSGPSNVTAFPVGCGQDGRECEPAWRAELGRYVSVEYADDRFVIAASRFRKPGVFVIPTGCARECRPSWSVTDLGRVYGVTSDGQTVFVATSDRILGYPLDCSDPCSAMWSGEVTGETWGLIVGDRRLVAASRTGGDATTGVRLTAFSSGET